MRVILSVITLSLSFLVQAQEKIRVSSIDTLPISKLIDNFNKYKLRESLYDVNRYDYFVRHERAKKQYFEISPLKALKGIRVLNCRGEWNLNYENNQFHLYLTKIVPLDGSTKEYADGLYLSLEKKYGKITSKGIPAKWVNGKYSVLYCLKNLFGEVVSRDNIVLYFQNGVQISDTRVLSFGEMEKEKMEDVIIRLGGCWYEDLPLYMRYLSRFVNGYRKIRSDSDVEKKFALLLFTDLNGRSQLICLNKKEVIDANRVILDDLKNCLAQLPVNSFGYMKTLQGKIFQGRYLIGTYIGNLGWFFTDYVNHP